MPPGAGPARAGSAVELVRLPEADPAVVVAGERDTPSSSTTTLVDRLLAGPAQRRLALVAAGDVTRRRRCATGRCRRHRRPCRPRPPASRRSGTAATALAHWSPAPPRTPDSPRSTSTPSVDVHARASALPLRSSDPTTTKPSSLGRARVGLLVAARRRTSRRRPSSHSPLVRMRRRTRRRSPPAPPRRPTTMAVSSGPTHTSRSAGCPDRRAAGVLVLERRAVGRHHHDRRRRPAVVHDPTAMNPLPMGATARATGCRRRRRGDRLRRLPRLHLRRWRRQPPGVGFVEELEVSSLTRRSGRADAGPVLAVGRDPHQAVGLVRRSTDPRLAASAAVLDADGDEAAGVAARRP